MTEELSCYQAYARFVRYVLILSGLWPILENESSFFYRLLPIVTTLSGIVMSCGVLKFCQENMGNLNIFTKGLCLLGSLPLVVLKAYQFFVYRKQLRKLNDILDTMFNEAIGDARLRPVLFSLFGVFRSPAYIVSSLAIATTGTYAITPLVSIIYQEIVHVHPKRYILPYPGSFPWKFEPPDTVYQLHYFFEAQFSWFVAFVTGGVDALFNFYSFQISALLRASAYECKHLATTCDEFDKILRNCVRKHNLLLQCRDILQDVYGPIILFLCTTSAIVLCALIFQASQLSHMNLQAIILLLVYTLLKMAQILIYSFYGTVITSEAEAFRYNMYFSNWYKHRNVSLMKNILLIITQRPISLVACRFFRISMDIFITIINTTISYFFLLRTLDDNNKS